jgi:hypothetical protein
MKPELVCFTCFQIMQSGNAGVWAGNAAVGAGVGAELAGFELIGDEASAGAAAVADLKGVHGSPNRNAAGGAAAAAGGDGGDPPLKSPGAGPPPRGQQQQSEGCSCTAKV